MIIQAAKFAVDVFGVGLLEELAEDAWTRLRQLFELPALMWAVFVSMFGG